MAKLFFNFQNLLFCPLLRAGGGHGKACVLSPHPHHSLPSPPPLSPFSHPPTPVAENYPFSHLAFSFPLFSLYLILDTLKKYVLVLTDNQYKNCPTYSFLYLNIFIIFLLVFNPFAKQFSLQLITI